MRPLVQSYARICTVAFIVAFAVGGCCSSGSKDESAQKPDAAPAASSAVAVTPPPAVNTFGNLGPTVDAVQSAEAAAAVPARKIAGAAHILVAYKGAELAPKTITRSKEQAKTRADEALAKLKDKKATFEELVTQYSDDPISKPTAGKIGNFEPNAMPQAFSDKTFSMTVDEVSDIVETPRGFHIIKRTF